ncbi:MAG: tRNA (guanine-N7)-methyltransferase, partial [Acetobacteraceae bacterium]
MEVKPPPDRLYGRARGHALRPRQRRLLDVALPRLAFRPENAAAPLAAFG